MEIDSQVPQQPTLEYETQELQKQLASIGDYFKDFQAIDLEIMPPEFVKEMNDCFAGFKARVKEFLERSNDSRKPR